MKFLSGHERCKIVIITLNVLQKNENIGRVNINIIMFVGRCL